jgi:hypothetical protein
MDVHILGFEGFISTNKHPHPPPNPHFIPCTEGYGMRDFGLLESGCYDKILRMTVASAALGEKW